MADDLTAAELNRLPFPEQLAALDVAVSGGNRQHLAALLPTLAALSDHEPLAHCVREALRHGLVSTPETQSALQSALARAPDTGVQRVLRGIDRADGLDGAMLAPLCLAVASTLDQLDLSRIGAICLMDRWLKNAAPDKRATLRDHAIGTAQAAIAAGDDAIAKLSDRVMIRLPGKHAATLSAMAHRAGRIDAWRTRVTRFANNVLATLRDAPRSLSQANAEELLSRRVYTDPGHFLIELLQNAEDAGASAFRVGIAEAGVTVWHDGAPFDARDVVGVLSIGQTTKSRDQIGFFGVGFKSVYEVCERPQVYCRPFRFEIADVSIPRPLPSRPPSPHPDDGTLLVLPFRVPRDPEHAPRALLDRALAVPPETLLTLKHLREMTLMLDVTTSSATASHGGDRQARTVTRTDRPSETGAAAVRRVQLRIDAAGPAVDNAVEHRTYVVAEDTFRYDGPRRELSKGMSTRSLVAIQLDADGRPVAVAEGAPTIFSHLPTGERSGLRFIVHGHFDVPVDRERLDLASAWNRWGLVQAGHLLAQAAAAVCASDRVDAALALLDIVPLAGELGHPAYEAVARAATPTLSQLPLLPEAGGSERLAPSGSCLVDSQELAIALRGVDLDQQGRRAVAPLPQRRSDVATSLGALPFTPSDLVQLLSRTQSTAAEGEPPRADWVTAAAGPILLTLARGEVDDELKALSPAPLLPDDAGRAWSAGRIRRTTPGLRQLYAGAVRPFLSQDLDETADAAQARVLTLLGVQTHDDVALLDDLHEPAHRAELLDAAGAVALHSYLGRLGHALTAPLASVPLFEVITTGSPAWLPLRPDATGGPRAYLLPAQPLRALVLGLPPAVRPPLVTSELCDALPSYLIGLGGQPLDLLTLIAHLSLPARAQLSADLLLPLHEYLAHEASRLSRAELDALRHAPIYPDVSGVLRPLTGGSLLPEDDGIERLVSGAPWLARALRHHAHIHLLTRSAVGVADIVEQLSADSGPLVSLGDMRQTTRRHDVIAYLIERASMLSAHHAGLLAAAPLWAARANGAETAQPVGDTTDTLGALATRRGPQPDADIGLLLDLVAGCPELEPADLELANALGLDDALHRSDLAGLLSDLCLHVVEQGELERRCQAAGVALDDARAALSRCLSRAATELSAVELAPIVGAAVFEGVDGILRPAGSWQEPAADAVYRAPSSVRDALGRCERVLISLPAEAAHGPLLDAAGIAPAGLSAVVAALESDPPGDALAAGSARRALLALADAPAAQAELRLSDGDSLARRVAELPLWPTSTGGLASATGCVRATELTALVGLEGARDITDSLGELDAVLAAGPTVDDDAAAFASLGVAFRPPDALIIERVTALAAIGEPVERQAPLLADRERVATLLALVSDALADGTETDSPTTGSELPLWVSVDGALVTGPLVRLDAAFTSLTDGIPLRRHVAEPSWAAHVNQLRPATVLALPPQRLLRALADAARVSQPDAAGAAAPAPALATIAGRATWHAYLQHHAELIAGDPQALGILGKAPLLLTEGGVWRAPRDLLLSTDAGDRLPDDDALVDWRPAAEIPRALCRWLDQVVQIERGRRRQLMTILVAAHRDAEEKRDLDRSVALIAGIAGCWPLADGAQADDDKVALEWSRKNHKLNRLRVAAAPLGGEAAPTWVQIGKLMAPTQAERPLLAAFLTEPTQLVSAQYGEGTSGSTIIEMLGRMGATRRLSPARLKELLDTGVGLAPELSATLALSRYIAMDAAALKGALDLANAHWVPDGTEQRRSPAQLYWPTPDAQALLGDAPHLYPHPEFFVTLPRAVSDSLPFRRVADASPHDVLQALESNSAPREVSAQALRWLDRALTLDAVAPTELDRMRRVFAEPRIVDDNGRLRAAKDLVITPEPELIGDALTGWAEGADVPALARALGVARTVDRTAVVTYLEHVAKRVQRDGSAATLRHDPALRQRLPRCLRRLAAHGSTSATPIALMALDADGQDLLVTSDEPALAIPFPAALAAIATNVLLAQGASEARTRAYLRDAGVVDLWALFTPEASTARVDDDVTTEHAAAVRLVRAALERVLRSLGLDDQPATVRVASTVHLVGRLAGHPVRTPVLARFDLDLKRLVVDASLVTPSRHHRTTHGLTDAGHYLVAEAIVGAAGVPPRRSEQALVAVVDGLRGAEVAHASPACPTLPPPSRSQPSPSGRDAAAHEAAEPAPSAPVRDAPASDALDTEKSLWAKVRGWFGGDEDEDKDEVEEVEKDAPSPREALLPADAGRGGDRSPAPPEPDESVPFTVPDQSQWFQTTDSVTSQLDSQGTFSRDRTAAAEFGYHFSPSDLPFPYRYAPVSITGDFHPASQTWLPIRGQLVASGRRALAPGTFAVALRGYLPRGMNLFPTPLYGRLTAVDGRGARHIDGADGRHYIAMKEPAAVACTVELDTAPEFEDASVHQTLHPTDPDAVRRLLAATVPDSDLPDEVLALCEDVRVSDEAALSKALRVKRFLQTRYFYDPSYLEDASVARWLRRATRGRANVHIAALHALGDSRHLGRGVCFELGVMACELLRRVGIPAAISKGWVWEGGQLAAPDHLWAMALLPSNAGPRWVPIDPATRDGRALRVHAQARMEGISAPEPAPGDNAPESPDWSDGDERGDWEASDTRSPESGSDHRDSARRRHERRRGGPYQQPSSGPRGGQRQTQAVRRRRERRRQDTPPIGELMKVVKHLSDVTGESLDGQALYRRCRALLADPDAAARLLAAMELADDDT